MREMAARAACSTPSRKGHTDQPRMMPDPRDALQGCTLVAYISSILTLGILLVTRHPPSGTWSHTLIE